MRPHLACDLSRLESAEDSQLVAAPIRPENTNRAVLSLRPAPAGPTRIYSTERSNTVMRM
jgi:hypothetical protein